MKSTMTVGASMPDGVPCSWSQLFVSCDDSVAGVVIADAVRSGEHREHIAKMVDVTDARALVGSVEHVVVEEQGVAVAG